VAAVLCGVEALSAQRRAVGAISLCAVVLCERRPDGTSVLNEICGTVPAPRELKGEG